MASTLVKISVPDRLAAELPTDPALPSAGSRIISTSRCHPRSRWPTAASATFAPRRTRARKRWRESCAEVGEAQWAGW